MSSSMSSIISASAGSDESGSIRLAVPMPTDTNEGKAEPLATSRSFSVIAVSVAGGADISA
jgi:hypothetical protein